MPKSTVLDPMTAQTKSVIVLPDVQVTTSIPDAFLRSMETPDPTFSLEQRQGIADIINDESRREVEHLLGYDLPKDIQLPKVGPYHEAVDQVIEAIGVKSSGQEVDVTDTIIQLVAIPLHSMVNPTLKALGETDEEFDIRFSYCGIWDMELDACACIRSLGCTPR